MKSFRTLFPVLGVMAFLAGCSGSASEGSNTGAASPIVASDKAEGTSDKGGGPAFEHRGGPGGGPEMLVFAALHEKSLNLTPEQRTTIEALVAKGKGTHGRDHAARPAPDASKRAELATAIRSGNVDASKLAVAPKVDGEKMMQEHQAKAAEKIATLHKTLTKEQRSALVDAVSSRMAKGPAGHREGRAEGRPQGGGEGRAEGRQGHFGHERGPMHFLDGLDLTQAQKDELKTKLAANRPARPTEADIAAMKASMNEKLQSFKADTFDATAFVARPANAPKMNMGNPAEHMGKELAAVVSVLTPAQREKLAQKIEQGPPARAR